MIALIVVLIVIAILAIAVIALYNNLVQLRNRVDNAWSQIDVQLQRRLDLIPNTISKPLKEIRLRMSAGTFRSSNASTQCGYDSFPRLKRRYGSRQCAHWHAEEPLRGC